MDKLIWGLRISIKSDEFIESTRELKSTNNPMAEICYANKSVQLITVHLRNGNLIT